MHKHTYFRTLSSWIEGHLETSQNIYWYVLKNRCSMFDIPLCSVYKLIFKYFFIQIFCTSPYWNIWLCLMSIIYLHRSLACITTWRSLSRSFADIDVTVVESTTKATTWMQSLSFGRELNSGCLGVISTAGLNWKTLSNSISDYVFDFMLCTRSQNNFPQPV